MSQLLVPCRQEKEGVVLRISAAEAGWEHLNMSFLRLPEHRLYTSHTGAHEYVCVILGGRCDMRTSRGDFLEVGRRADVFSGMPHAVYLPRQTEFQIRALSGGVEVALGWASTDQDHEPRLVRPQDVAVEIRGGGNATRQINSIVPPGFPCHRLVCVEVYTPSGNWSSYPPHKHDQHRVDEQGNLLEADLEEIYFYKIRPENGYAYQRVYTGKGRDELLQVRHNEAVLVPEGYHPVVAGHGYDVYYLNFLAGSAQSLANSDDPEHAWIKSTWTSQDPRLPMVHPAP